MTGPPTASAATATAISATPSSRPISTEPGRPAERIASAADRGPRHLQAAGDGEQEGGREEGAGERGHARDRTNRADVGRLAPTRRRHRVDAAPQVAAAGSSCGPTSTIGCGACRPCPGTVVSLMKATVEPLEGNKVKVSVEVDETEFEKQVDAAFKRIAREVRIPGFRPGKAPREAARGPHRHGGGPRRRPPALGARLLRARRSSRTRSTSSPSPRSTSPSGEESGDVAFDAVVEIRPKVIVGGYASLRITVDNPEASDEEIEERIDRLREGFAELEDVDRPAIDGDNVTIDIAGTQDGEPQPGLTADDYLYEVGSGTVVPELDEQLAGAKVGDILEFDADHPDPDEDQVHFRILVKGIKEKVLPEANDEWAAESSEFETLDELRADLEEAPRPS